MKPGCLSQYSDYATGWMLNQRSISSIQRSLHSSVANPSLEVRSSRSIYNVSLYCSVRPDLHISIYHCFCHPHSI